MSRPIRVEYPNAHYHVINRGNRRECVFTADSDYELFLEKLAEYAEAYEIEIHGYCLMPNHFHLQLMTRLANLSKFMQSFLTSFTLAMNHKYNKSGHLFQGRYKADLVESERYKNKLSRYIHLNPVKVQTMADVEFETKKQYLHDFKWSSFRAYIGLESKPKWLARNHVLSSWGKSAGEKMSHYRKYVEEGIAADNVKELEAVMPGLIGSDSFKDKIIKKFMVRDVADIDSREQALLAKINTLSMDEVVDMVAKNLQEDVGVKLKRKITILMVIKHCRKNNSLVDISEKFALSISGLNMATHRFKLQIKEDKNLQQLIANIDEILKRKCKKV